MNIDFELHVVIQIFTFILSSLSIGMIFLVLKKLSNNLSLSIISALLFGTSWSYWALSTDIHYLPISALLTAAALLSIFDPQRTNKNMIWIGVLCGLAVLGWQANVFLIPALSIIIFLHSKETSRQKVFKHISIFVLAALSVVGAAYFASAVLVHNAGSVSEVISWALGHSSDSGGRPLLWGKWELGRIKDLGQWFIGSFIPIWEGLGLSELLTLDIQAEKIIGQLSLVSLSGLLVLTGLQFIKNWRMNKREQCFEVIVYLICFSIFMPFILWWEPYQPYWYMIPNIFLVMAFVKVFSDFSKENSLLSKVLIGLIIVIAAANCSMTIHPRHTVPNPNISAAECFTENTSKTDSLILTDWNWYNYAVIFFGYEGETIYLTRGENNFTQNTQLIESKILEKGDGRILVTNIDSYSLEELDWSKEYLGLEIEVIGEFESDQEFMCGDVQIDQLSISK